MKLSNLLIIFLLGISLSVSAQPGQYSTNNNKAIKLFEKARGIYLSPKAAKGIDYYSIEKNLLASLEKDPGFFEARNFLVEIYERGGLKNKAADQWEELIKNGGSRFSKSIYFYAASSNLAVGRYDKVKEYTEAYLRVNAQNRNANQTLIDRAHYMQANASFAINAMKNPVEFEPVNLGPGVNTAEMEYFPTITGDDQNLIFTRRVHDKNSANGLGLNEDFFVSKLLPSGKWGTGSGISPRINSYFNEGAPSISSDGKKIVFAACDIGDNNYGPKRDGFGSCDLFITVNIGGNWDSPKNLGRPVNTPHWETQPSVSSDGKTIYFIHGKWIVNNQRVATPHNPDIYETHLQENGEWSAPTPLSNVINTPQTESSVLIHPDGQTLYFSSDGHLGMGGSDLFMSRKQPNGEWGKAVNLGYPINTMNDENSLLVNSSGSVAYFASDRPGGFGMLDIYGFEMPENIRPQLTTFMKGVVFDIETEAKLGAKFELIDLETGQVFTKSTSDPKDGSFIFTVPTNKELALNVFKDGYLFYSKNFSFEDKKNKGEPYHVDVPLTPIKSTKEVEAIVLENVFFDTDKFDLKSKSRVELDKLYSFLEKNKEIKIQLRGHTDNRGGKEHNQVLSENRAKAVVDYLINKGITKERLSYKGFGDAMPLKTNETPEGRAKNRRTEYKIIK